MLVGSKFNEIQQNQTKARFVQLEDCGHCVESSLMNEMLESRFEASNENILIELPKCPTCETPIRRNLRYSKYIKEQLDLIEQVKMNLYYSIDLRQDKDKLEKFKSDLSLRLSSPSQVRIIVD